MFVCAVPLAWAILFQTPPSAFTPASLGGAYAAFEQPESVTIQSVYPADRGEKVERAFGPSRLRFVAKARRISPANVRRLIENYKNPYRVLEPNCSFHPDHHVVLSKGAHKVETVSCFTCDELMVIADGRYLGRFSMGPPKMLRMIYTSSVPLSDSIRAAAEEWLTREFVDELTKEGPSSARVVETAQTVPKRVSGWKSIGKQLPTDATFRRRLLDILEVHCLNNRLSFRFAQPEVPTFMPKPVAIQSGGFTLVLHGSYNRGELYAAGHWQRTIDLFGIEDRLQRLVLPILGSKR